MKGVFFVMVLLLITVLLIPLFIISSCELNEPIIDKPEEMVTVESDLKIFVYNHDTQQVMELYLEDYIQNVVAAEVPASFEIETLKAQAVAARTYAVWRIMQEGEPIHPDYPEAKLSTSHTDSQEWLSEEALQERHGKKWMTEYWPKIQEAVQETSGIIMTYDMHPIEPLYHSTSGGQTENSEDVFASAVPYLRSVSSPYESRSPVLADEKAIPIETFVQTLKGYRADLSLSESNLSGQMEILERTDGGSVRRIQVGNQEMTGREIRELFELRSADFTFEIRNNQVEFTTKGYGHGVGMSQWGANGMAEQGYSYEEILKHYYFGVTLSKLRQYSL